MPRAPRFQTPIHIFLPIVRLRNAELLHFLNDYSTSARKVKGKPALVFRNHFPYNVLQFTHALREIFFLSASRLAKQEEYFPEYMADAISEKKRQSRGIELACVKDQEGYHLSASRLAKQEEYFPEYMADAISEKKRQSRGIELACAVSEK